MSKEIVKIAIQSPFNANGYNVEIVKGQSIRIQANVQTSSQGFTQYDTSFKVGDKAEYDSYNLSYIGEIVQITDKTVTILPQYETKVRRLKLSEFCWRNYRFNLQETLKSNEAESYCI